MHVRFLYLNIRVHYLRILLTDSSKTKSNVNYSYRAVNTPSVVKPNYLIMYKDVDCFSQIHEDREMHEGGGSSFVGSCTALPVSLLFYHTTYTAWATCGIFKMLSLAVHKVNTVT